MVLFVNQLNGGYGKTQILKNISFNINSGEMVALIGLNGAGKSTLIKHLMGLLKPFSGEMTINGVTQDNSALQKQQMIFVPEMPVLYAEMTLREHIEFVGLTFHLTPEQSLTAAEPYLKAFRLEKRLGWFPSVFSKGMQQKVMLTLALMIQVPLYVIDEPFLGLDPLAIKQLLRFLEHKKQQGSSILMTTHLLSLAQKQCDRFIFLHQGEIKKMGTLEEVRLQAQSKNMDLEDFYIEMAEQYVE